MKKVGILTLYWQTYNYGAQLQAYALQRKISNLGYECEQIQYKWCKEQIIENYSQASINQRAFSAFSNSIKHSNMVFSSENIDECVNDYDVFVTGSDQVFGVENSMPDINLPIMALSFVPDEKVKIAYAASMGNAELSSKRRAVLKNCLPGLDRISMREKQASAYISQMIGKRVDTVLDPVFLLNKEEWNEISKDAKSFNEEYIFFYSAGYDSFHEKIVEKLQEKYGIPVKRLGYIEGEKIGPLDFISWIKGARYVVTDSFHALAFSIIYHKNFVSLPIDTIPTSRSKNVRIKNLLNLVDLEDRFINGKICNLSDISKITERLEKPIPFEKVERLLDELKEESVNFLKTSLSVTKDKGGFLVPKSECSGCGCCKLVCPVGAIDMVPDQYGFLYPKKNSDKCIECGKCMDICRKECSENAFIELCGLQSSKDEIRSKASSGGAFFEISKAFIDQGGTVVACKYDANFNPVHDFCDSVTQLDSFCRSKYVQSNAYFTFSDIKKRLDENKKILFVGTPCQTSALFSFLGREYPNLYLADLICGGVGALKLWEKYLESQNKDESLKSISMRHKYSEYLKPEGFPAFSMKLDYETESKVFEGSEDYYLNSRLSFYRDSCYNCKYKGGRRKSDITIGDFVKMNYLKSRDYDGLGTTLAIVWTKKGESLLENCKSSLNHLKIDQTEEKSILDSNVMISLRMQKKPQHYYLRSIFPDSSIEEIFWANKYWDEFNLNEFYLKNIFKDRKRNELLLKTERAISYNLWLDEDPMVCGAVFIYGAGVVGRRLIRCIKNIDGFIESKAMIPSCEGLKVFSFEDSELKALIEKKKEVTVIVTPVWDFQIIFEKFEKNFPKVRVISLNELVENIWI